MPQRKDPDIPIRQALALVPWPGASAEKIEQLVTRRVEEKVAENAKVEKIESNTRTGVTVDLHHPGRGDARDGKEFDDIKLKLDAINDLPDGAGPINFVKDFGDTAALMLTVASPKVGATEIALRARSLQQAIERARAEPARLVHAARGDCARPAGLDPPGRWRAAGRACSSGRDRGRPRSRDARVLDGAGFIGVDARRPTRRRDARATSQRFVRERMQASEIHPDAGPPSSSAIRPRRGEAARRGGRQVQLPRARRLHRSDRPLIVLFDFIEEMHAHGKPLGSKRCSTPGSCGCGR